MTPATRDPDFPDVMRQPAVNLFLGTAHVRCWGKLRRCPNPACLVAFTVLSICRCGTPTHDLGERKEAA